MKYYYKNDSPVKKKTSPEGMTDDGMVWLDDEPPRRTRPDIPIKRPLGAKKDTKNGAAGRRRGLAGRGLTNGTGLINGNGIVNGMGLTNGNGLADLKGLTRGGLINGNGMTNGDGLLKYYYLRKTSKQLSREERKRFARISLIKQHRKREIVGAATLITAILLIPILLYVFSIGGTEGIKIDGEFGDWKGVVSYQDPKLDQVNNSDVNLVEYRMDRTGDLVSFYLRVDGGVLGGAVSTDEAGLDSVQIFIDSDQDGTTGYSIGGIGSDHMLEICGYEGKVVNSIEKRFDGDKYEQNDWNGWEMAYSVQAAVKGNELETQCWLPENRMATNDLEVYFHIGDTEGNEDRSDGVISTRPGMLVARQRSIAGDIIERGIEDVLELELTARGRSITIESIDFTNTGLAAVLPVPTPITLQKDETVTRIVRLNTSSGDPGDLVGLEISSASQISVDSGKVTLLGRGAKAYLETPPSRIIIDGAFGDWAQIAKKTDEDEQPVPNKNVDLAEYKITRDDKDVSFYMSVQGSMMGGTWIPQLPKYLSLLPPKPAPPPATDVPPPTPIDPQKMRPELAAEDTLCILLDTDSDGNTGYRVSDLGGQISDIGADHMIKITGKYGEVKTNGYYRFNGSNAKDWNWIHTGPVRTGIDAGRLETQIEYDMIGLEPGDGLGVWFYAFDWNKASVDRSSDNEWPELNVPSFAPSAPDPDAEEDDQGQVQETTRTSIQLVAGTFDPLVEEEPIADQDLETDVPSGYYLVQFIGSIKDEWKQEVEELGGTFYGYVPDYTFIVKIDDDALLDELPYVRWTGYYQPAYKVQGGVISNGTDNIDIDVLVFDDLELATSQIEALGGVITSRWDFKLCVNISRERIPDVLSIPEVEWVEETPEFKIENNVADDLSRLNVEQLWSNPYHLNGTGQIVAVCDTGIDTGVDDSTMHDDIEGRIVAIYDSLGGNADGTKDVVSGHGTHVTGSVLGNGSRSSGSIKGMAPCASLVFQASECYSSSSGYFLDLPSDLNTLFQQAYDDGARIHTNSWGSAAMGQYTSYSQDVDEFTWANKDMLILFAAGNEGIDANSNGIIDLDSMNAPSTAKNALTVGATENLRSTGGYQFQWATGSWATKYPANPIKSDMISNNSQGMAAFSSRGPCDDGRLKPDVVAPGTNVLSTKSSQTTQVMWGIYDSYYTYAGGTSMATPLVAGCSALVRQFYVDNESLESPSGALIKATLINGAIDIKGQYAGAQNDAGPIPNNNEGWGMVNVTNSIHPTAPREMTYKDATSGFTASGQFHEYKYRVGTGEPLKITLAYSDYPGSPTSGGLVNDLNLKVTAPDGSTNYLGNDFTNGWTKSGGSITDNKNNVECVYIKTPSAGTYTVRITAQNIAELGFESDQDYALVVSGNFTFPDDVGVQSIKVNNTQLNNTKAKIDATIMNYGKNDQADPFNARCVVKDPGGTEVLNTTQSVTSIPSKTTVEKTFYYTPVSEGIHTITIRTELKTDDYNDNNATSVFLTVPLIMNEIATMVGSGAGDLFGFNVTSGKLNNDDYGDVIVGAPGANKAYVFYGYPSMAGGLYAKSANVTISGPDSNSDFGWSVGISDVTGDGYDDVIVGAPKYNSYQGRAYIYRSSSSGVTDTTVDATITGGNTGDRFGCSVSGAGDVNGLNNEDIVIGAYLDDTLDNSKTDAGMAFVFFGDSGLSGSLTVASADANIIGQVAGDHLGFSVSSAGDVNHDGYSDIIVGAPSAGKAYIYYGFPGLGKGGVIKLFSDGFESGSITTKRWTAVDSMGTGWKTYTSPSAYSGTYSAGSLLENMYDTGLRYMWVGINTTYCTGTTVQYAQYGQDSVNPDFGNAGGSYSTNGGGAWTDFETGMGSMSWSSRGPFSLPTSCNDNRNFRIRLWEDLTETKNAYSGDGPLFDDVLVSGTLASGIALPNVTLKAEDPNDRFGWSVNCSGNVNGDSYDDVVIGAPGYQSSTGRAYVFYGSGSLPDIIPAGSADVKLSGAAEGDRFGYSVGAADMGADGFCDILVGAPYNDTIDGSKADAGAVYVFNGSASMPPVICAENCTRYGETAQDHFGWSVSTARDVNFDTFDDIVVGAPHYDNGTDTNAGKVYLLTTRDLLGIPEFTTIAIPLMIVVSVPVIFGILRRRRKQTGKK